MEGVAPRDPIVAVAELVQAGVVAARAERLLERPVRGEVLLDGAAREHDRDRPLRPVAVDAADEAGDPLVAREAALVALGAAEEAARLEEEGVEAVRMAPVRVEERERAEARADPDPCRGGRELREDLLRERARVAGGGGVGLVAVDRAEEGRAERRQRAQVRSSAECAAYSGPSCATRSGLRSVASGCAQISAGSSALRIGSGS